MVDVKKRMSDVDDFISRTESKKAKKDDAQNEEGCLASFSGFEVVKILREDAQRKAIFVQGRFKDKEEDTVVILEKTPFSVKTLPSVLSQGTSLTVELKNDIYSQYICRLNPDLNTINGTVISPATAKHLDKYAQQDTFLVYETPEDYHSITEPYVTKKALSIQWVHNILDKKAEEERIVFEDSDPTTGFILVPDMKWDQRQTENLYLVAICHQRGIKSLRDLTDKHLPLLKNILAKGTEAIGMKYQVLSSQLRVYVHYQPSYYHFHVHFTHLGFDAPGSNAGRAHLLQDVIDNIENVQPEFYQRKTLPCTLREKDTLFNLFQEAGRV